MGEFSDLLSKYGDTDITQDIPYEMNELPSTACYKMLPDHFIFHLSYHERGNIMIPFQQHILSLNINIMHKQFSDVQDIWPVIEVHCTAPDPKYNKSWVKLISNQIETHSADAHSQQRNEV